MEKIASFTVNHLNLLPGVYVSRKDNVGGNVITTFDLRMTRPNYEPVMNTAEVHTIEHLAATFLRNHKEYGEKIIYFGPMGCRTGFYLILAGEYESKDIVPLLKELYTFMSEFEGDVPGACARDCVNKQNQPIVFLLWGSFAQKKAAMLDNPNHLILKAPHPSPLSAYRGFFGCKHFSQANEFLQRHGVAPIDWQIENI